MTNDAQRNAQQSADPKGDALKLALMWRGDPDMPDQSSRHRARLQPLTEALIQAGVEVQPVIYADEAIEAVRAQLLQCHGVMVWVDPLDNGRDRSRLDPVLAQVAGTGVWVSAHPDVILKMGTKEVLFRTQGLGWGAETHLYRTFDAFQEQFPTRLAAEVPRILKPNRGNGGQGVWKVQWARGDEKMVEVQSARDDRVEVLPLSEFLQRCQTYFAAEGFLVDQAFLPRVSDGMVRCYLSQDKVVGFSEQWPRISDSTPELPALGMNSAKTMHEPGTPRFRFLRQRMEDAWLPAMLNLLELNPAVLPAIWDADFLRGPKLVSGEDSYVLCEINISSVLPFPDTAVGSVARTAVGCMEWARRMRSTVK